MERREFLAAVTAWSVVASTPGCGRAATEVSRLPRDLQAQQQITRDLALRFGLRPDELALFDEGWALYERVVREADASDREGVLAALGAAGEAAVAESVVQLAAVCSGGLTEGAGFTSVRRIPRASRRWVVFSDHHLTYQGHRTNFFGASGNLALYAEVLGHYDRARFSLVENGDVEDLVIFDPALLPGEARHRESLALAGLEARRLEVRSAQLGRVLADPANAPYYDALARFAA